METDKLIQVIRALTKDCITKESAKKMISELTLIDKPMELEPQDMIEGIKELIKMRLIQMDEGTSYIKRIYEVQIQKEGYYETGRNIAIDPDRKKKKKYTKMSGYKARFSGGELQDAVKKSIMSGNKVHSAIVMDLAQKFGRDEKEIRQTVYSTLHNLYKAGVLDRVKTPEGITKYDVIVFDSKEQAGIVDFHPKKEIENEFRGVA